MSKQVNIHHKRFADFLHYLKEHQAEITVHSPGGDRMTYTFRKNGPLIKSLVCHALDENETVVNEYFRTNLKSDHIATQKRKAFYRRVNIIHDINATCYRKDQNSPYEDMLSGNTLSLPDIHQLYPWFHNVFSLSLSKMLEELLAGDRNDTTDILTSDFLFEDEVTLVLNHLDEFLENEQFREQLSGLSTTYTLLAETSPEETFFYPDFTFLYQPGASNLLRKVAYTRSDYAGSIELDRQRCRKLWYGKYLFSDEPVTSWPVSYTTHLLLSFLEYQSILYLGLKAMVPDFEEEIRFQINASTDGMSVEYGKGNLTLDDLVEELAYYHFHKNPEQLISKDPSHLLTEEIKKNKTGSQSDAIDKDVLKTIISNRIKAKYLGSVMKTFGYSK